MNEMEHQVDLVSYLWYHDRFDALDCMSGEQMEEDFAFVLAVAKRMAATKHCPFPRENAGGYARQAGQLSGYQVY